MLASVSVGQPCPTSSPALEGSVPLPFAFVLHLKMREAEEEGDGGRMKIITCALVVAIAGGPVQVTARQATRAHSACRDWLPTLSTMPAWQSWGLCKRGRNRQGKQTRDALTASQAGLYTHKRLCIDCWSIQGFMPGSAVLRAGQARFATSGLRTTRPVRVPGKAKNQGANDENLSDQDKERAKGLADAWIKVDKVNECKVALQGRSIFLLGLPSSPMKSVGLLIQKRFENYRFLDAVEVTSSAVKIAGADCQDPRPLVDALGADAVLDVEEQVLDQLQGMLRSVFACDARMVQRPQNGIRMGQGVIVYLQAPVEPPAGSSWTQDELDELASDNCALMEDMCDCIVELPATGSVPTDELAMQVIDEVRNYCLATKNRESRRGTKKRSAHENRNF